MIRILLILSVLFFSNLAQAQDCTIPQVLVDYYDNDVKDLALKRMKDLNAPELSEIEIAQTYQDTIMRGLAAIYNSSNCQKKQIFNEYCIHQTNKSVGDRFYIKIDTTASWYDNWKNGIITTEIDEIDSLLAKYGFNEVIKHDFPYNDLFTLTSTHFLNLKPLTDIFETFPKVIYAEQIPNIGSGNQILYEKINNTQYYTFILGWGDCPVGCTIFHIWKYAVNEDCEVTFLEESGSPIPFPGINCNISGTYIPATISASNNDFCIGDSSILSVDRGEQFLWSTGETSQNITIKDAGNYFVTITENNGCVKYANISISMATPGINFPNLGDTICYSNNSIDLVAHPNDGQFKINQEEASVSFIPSQLDFGLNTISYSRLDTTSGCTNTVTQNIIIHQDTTEITGDKSFCAGGTTLLSVSRDDAFDFIWNNDSKYYEIDVAEAGLYSVNFTTSDGCIHYAETYIEKNPLPSVSLNFDKDEFKLHQDRIQLSGGLPLGGNYYGDGVFQNNFIPQAAGLGFHSISYEVKDANTNCTASENQIINVIDDFIKYDVSQEGNQWNIADFHNQDTSILRIRVKGDTIIQNKAYRKLEINTPGSLEWVSMNKYIRQDSSKRVFIKIEEDSKAILYDFNLQVNDYFNENAPDKTISVQKVDYVLDLNGQLRKQIQLKVLDNDHEYNEMWIEGIGSMKYLTHAISEDNSYYLMCFYQNGELVYQQDPQAICIFDPTTATENIINSNEISVVPNPVLAYFQLDGIEDLPIDAIHLHSIDGKLLKSYEINQKYDISDLQNGVYFISIISGDQNITKKVVVEK